MQVKIVRIYLSENSELLQEFYDYLHEKKVKGATIFRGVKGFGSSGKDYEARLLDVRANLPVVLEFFDEPEHVDDILKHFTDNFKPIHVIQWLAEAI